MISADYAGKQIKRLAQMKYYPRGDKEALQELAEALQSAANEEQAKAVVSEILATATSDSVCPMPAEIQAAANARKGESRPDPLCQICGGDGWRTITRGGYSGSDRCSCWAPRPAPAIEFVPLPGSPGYVPPPPLPSRDEIRRNLEGLKSWVRASEVKL